MKRFITLVVLGLLVVVLAACNEQPKETAVSDSGGKLVTDPAKTPAADDGVSDTVVADAVEDPPVKATADKLPPENDAPAGLAKELVGDWYALFGTHDNGVVTEPWKGSHRFTFSQDKTGRLIKFEGDEATESLFVKWHVDNEDLLINFIAADAVAMGLSQVAPLGIARDEETGLLPLGVARDEETGLLTGEVPEVSGGNDLYRRCLLSADLSDNYLVLRDQHHRVMIYGRSIQGDRGMPDLSGDWVGHIDMHDNFSASFEVQDDGTVIGTYDHDGGKFVGRLFKGYLVGKVDYGMKSNLAALYLAEDWELDGVYCAPPYQEVVERYNFNRYTE